MRNYLDTYENLLYCKSVQMEKMLTSRKVRPRQGHFFTIPSTFSIHLPQIQ